MDYVFRVRASGVVPVLPVAARLVAVVLTQVVAPAYTVPAVAAAGVAGAGHTVADAPTERVTTHAQSHDCAGPLVPGCKGVAPRPKSLVVAIDNVRIGTANVDRVHPAQQLHPTRSSDLDAL